MEMVCTCTNKDLWLILLWYYSTSVSFFPVRFFKRILLKTTGNPWFDHSGILSLVTRHLIHHKEFLMNSVNFCWFVPHFSDVKKPHNPNLLKKIVGKRCSLSACICRNWNDCSHNFNSFLLKLCSFWRSV